MIDDVTTAVQADERRRAEDRERESEARAQVTARFDSVAAFEKSPGHGWAYVGGPASGSCPEAVPAPVYAVWGICASAHNRTAGT